jgi:hypothetical protein
MLLLDGWGYILMCLCLDGGIPVSAHAGLSARVEGPEAQPAGDAASGSWGQQEPQQRFQGVTNSMPSGSVVETRTVEGNSPVR